MNKVKVLSRVAIALLLVNLILVGFIFFNKPARPDGPEERKNIIIEKLNFDAQQIQEYEQVIEGHRNSMRGNNQQMHELKNQLYSTLNTDTPAALKDSLIHAISQLQIIIENTNYTHFQNIKSICKKEQLAKYEELTTELSTFFAPKHLKPPPRIERP